MTQSNGGAFSLDAARSKPVHTIESGPAAGVTGSASLSRVLGADRLISFDMGGTTAKCAIVERGLVQTTAEYHVDGRPLRIPVIDIKEVSAGGGTIAWIDAGGALALGPHSAGADPGPVSYARGGTEPTVTDANLVLGRIDAARFLGGTMPLDLAGAVRAIDEKIGAPLGLTRAAAAAGVVRLADVKMALAVRSITTERGLDPRDYTLARLRRRRAAPRRRHRARARHPARGRAAVALDLLRLGNAGDRSSTRPGPHRARAARAGRRRRGLKRAMRRCSGRSSTILPGTGEPVLYRAADLRYLGQEHTVTIAAGVARRLDRAARASSTPPTSAPTATPHATSTSQLLNLRLTVVFPLEPPRLADARATRQPARHRSRRARSTRRSPADAIEYRVYQRASLRPRATQLKGPAAIEEPGTTTVIDAADTLSIEDHGCLVIDVAQPERWGFGGASIAPPEVMTIPTR